MAAALALNAQQAANRMTPLMQAAQVGHAQTVQLLLQASNYGLAQQP
jgi:ankyrin repeat protein